MEMNIVLVVFLCILAAACVWVAVEGALIIRKLRKKVDGLTDQLGTSLEKVDGILANVDQTISDLRPTLQALPAVVDNVDQTIGALKGDLTTVDTILSDVSTISGSAVSATNAISKGASQASTAVGGAVAKLGKAVSRKIAPKREAPALQEKAAKVALEEKVAEVADAVGVELPPEPSDSPNDGFFTYPSSGDDAGDSPEAA